MQTTIRNMHAKNHDFRKDNKQRLLPTKYFDYSLTVF